MDNYLIGTDIAKIERFEKLKKKESFLKKVFTAKELEYLKNKNFATQTIAGLFSAKEAAAKALKTGIGVLSFQDIQITHRNGIEIRFSKDFCVVDADISISHDGEYAQAVCILKKNPTLFHAPFRIKKRPENSHKGTFGKIAIIGGSEGMLGSICLCQMAALRSGSGLVYNIVPECISKIFQMKSLENIVLPACAEGSFFHIHAASEILTKCQTMDALAIGPGMGRFSDATLFMKEILTNTSKKVIVDADALNALSYEPEILFHRQPFSTVLTPHAQEMARLTGCSVKYVNEHREKIAVSFAKKYQAVVVLKGHHTIVTDGEDLYINQTGNAGMATAGSGDVLTGIVVSFLARYTALDAAKIATYLHGLAGDFAKENYGEESLIARDIIEYLPFAIQQIKEG